MSRRPIRRAAALAAGVALAAHLVYGYWPRARASRPATGDLARSFPASRSARVAVWLPYPHQNLAALDRRVGDLRVWIRGIAGGVRRDARLDVPSFGPFLVPPARELSAELGPEGELRVVARLYPTIAALARAAGTVASNPWLAGGDVSSSDSPATVRWDGRTWTLTRSPSPSTSSSSLSSSSPTSPSSPAGSDEGGSERGREAGDNLPVMGEGGAGAEVSAGREVEEARPTLAAGSASAAATGESFPSLEVFGLIWLGERLGPLPSSVYRVVPSDRVSSGLEVLAGEMEKAGPDRSWPDGLVDPEAGAPVGWLVERDEAGRVRGIAVWEGASGVKELPAIVVFGSSSETGGSGFAFELPGEGLLRLVGERAPEAEAAGLRLRALDRGTVERAAAWMPALASAFAGPAEAGAPPRALGAASPDRLAKLTSATARLLRAVPLVDPADAARFERVATLLQPIADCRLATLEVGGAEAVRIAPCD